MRERSLSFAYCATAFHRTYIRGIIRRRLIALRWWSVAAAEAPWSVNPARQRTYLLCFLHGHTSSRKHSARMERYKYSNTRISLNKIRIRLEVADSRANYAFDYFSARSFSCCFGGFPCDWKDEDWIKGISRKWQKSKLILPKQL